MVHAINGVEMPFTFEFCSKDLFLHSIVLNLKIDDGFLSLVLI